MTAAASSIPLPDGIEEVTATRGDRIELVARRMHLTLAEVLGDRRASELFTHDELVDRVTWHLDDVEGRRAAVFVAIGDDGHEVVGHTIVRVEPDLDDGPEIGLFSTTYVDPAHRRGRRAAALLDVGERWMRANGVTRAITYTDVDNRPLIALYRGRGYRLSSPEPGWARLERSITDEPADTPDGP